MMDLGTLQAHIKLEGADGFKSDLSGTAVTSVPTDAVTDVTYYAVFMDIPVATAGYYMPNNGLELANVLEYIEETSATSAKIFLKNGTYTLPRGASRHYTHKHSQTSAVLWDGDAYDPITYLKSSNVSFIGQSRDISLDRLRQRREPRFYLGSLFCKRGIRTFRPRRKANMPVACL